MKKTLFIVVVLSALSVIEVSHATMINVTFSGNVTSANDSGSQLSTTTISNSSTFSGSFSYNTNTPPSFVLPYTSVYDIEPGFNINIDGTYLFAINNPQVIISNDQPTSPPGYLDGIGAGGASQDGFVMPFSIPLLLEASFNIALSDWTGTALNSDSLPQSINLGAFGDRYMYISIEYLSPDGANFYDMLIDGTITSLNVEPAAVPEPTTMLLLGTGLVGIAGASRRRKKNQA